MIKTRPRMSSGAEQPTTEPFDREEVLQILQAFLLESCRVQLARLLLETDPHIHYGVPIESVRSSSGRFAPSRQPISSNPLTVPVHSPPWIHP